MGHRPPSRTPDCSQTVVTARCRAASLSQFAPDRDRTDLQALSASVAAKRPLSEVTRETAKLAASLIATRDSAYFAGDENRRVAASLM